MWHSLLSTVSTANKHGYLLCGFQNADALVFGSTAKGGSAISLMARANPVPRNRNSDKSRSSFLSHLEQCCLSVVAVARGSPKVGCFACTSE